MNDKILIQELNNQLSKMKLQLKRKDLEITRSLVREQEKEIEVLELQQKLNNIEKMTAANDTEKTERINQLTSKLEETEKLNFDLKQQVEKNQSEIESLKKEKEIEVLEVQQKLNNIKKMTAANDDKEKADQINQLTTKLEETEKLNSNLKEQVEKRKNEIRSLNKELEILSKKNEKLHGQNCSLRSNFVRLSEFYRKDESEDSMTIYIQTFRREEFVIRCKPSDTIMRVKEKLCILTGIPPEHLILLHGRELQDYRRVMDYKIEAGAVINFACTKPKP